MSSTRHFEAELCRSIAGTSKSIRATLEGLGLSRIGKRIYLPDTDPVRGMLYKVCRWVKLPRPVKRRYRWQFVRSAGRNCLVQIVDAPLPFLGKVASLVAIPLVRSGGLG